eukprot:808208-Rhodomonas_salina.2
MHGSQVPGLSPPHPLRSYPDGHDAQSWQGSPAYIVCKYMPSGQVTPAVCKANRATSSTAKARAADNEARAIVTLCLALHAPSACSNTAPGLKCAKHIRYFIPVPVYCHAQTASGTLFPYTGFPPHAQTASLTVAPQHSTDSLPHMHLLRGKVIPVRDLRVPWKAIVNAPEARVRVGRLRARLQPLRRRRRAARVILPVPRTGA